MKNQDVRHPYDSAQHLRYNVGVISSILEDPRVANSAQHLPQKVSERKTIDKLVMQNQKTNSSDSQDSRK